jgi:hypothetical protein
LPSKSLDRFGILPGSRFDQYAGDAECIDYRGKQIRGADAPTFRVMSQVELGRRAEPRELSLRPRQGPDLFRRPADQGRRRRYIRRAAPAGIGT